MELLTYKFLTIRTAGSIINSKELALHRTRNPQAPTTLYRQRSPQYTSDRTPISLMLNWEVGAKILVAARVGNQPLNPWSS